MTLTIWNDAGLLREYATGRLYGAALLYGTNWLRMREITRVLTRVSKLTGIPILQVRQDTIDDYNAADAHH